MTEPLNKFRWNDHPVRVALKDTASALATVMFNRAEMDGTKVYGSQEKLAEILGVSDRTVRRAQKQLETLGLIRRISTGSGFGSQSNSYVLTMPPAIPDIAIPDTEYSQVVSIPDTLPIPDMGVLHTGHGCPVIPDTGVRLIDPLLDPGNKPGSVEKQDIFNVLPTESDTESVRPRDPFSEEYIVDVLPRTDPFETFEGLSVIEPEQTYRSALDGHPEDVRLGDVPQSGTSTEICQPANEGTQPMSFNPADPFAPVDPFALQSESWPSEPTESRVPEPKALKVVDEFSRKLEEEHRRVLTPTETVIQWPTDTPLPENFDPFAAVYVDATTGEQLWPPVFT